MTTVQVLADKALDGGVDLRVALREVAIGVELTHLAERAVIATPPDQQRTEALPDDLEE